MSQVAEDAGLSRESLYKALSGERNPDFTTILKVIGALGLKLHADVRGPESAGFSVTSRVIPWATQTAGAVQRMFLSS